MLVAAIIVIGVLLVAGLVLAMARRQDTRRAVGVLSRETRKRDRSEAAIRPIADEAPVLSGRDVERAAAAERRTGTAVMEAPAVSTVPYVPPAPVDLEALGVTRRQFLNRAVLGVFGLSLASFGATMLAFLWPPPNNGGFGSKVNAGKLDDILATIDANKGPAYVPNARAYVNRYPVGDVPKAKKAGYSDAIVAGYEQGLVALYQKCVHLGCRVPWCTTSQWFECPCHGSQYNRVGEKKGGPAPRGLDRFVVSADGGVVTIDTKQVIVGPPIGTNTTGQEAEGPHCH